MALRAGELLRQRGVPYEDVDAHAPPARESGVFPVSVRAATYLEAVAADMVSLPVEEGEPIPISEPPMSLGPDNLARVLEALRART